MGSGNSLAMSDDLLIWLQTMQLSSQNSNTQTGKHYRYLPLMATGLLFQVPGSCAGCKLCADTSQQSVTCSTDAVLEPSVIQKQTAFLKSQHTPIQLHYGPFFFYDLKLTELGVLHEELPGLCCCKVAEVGQPWWSTSSELLVSDPCLIMLVLMKEDALSQRRVL